MQEPFSDVVHMVSNFVKWSLLDMNLSTGLLE
jgi:hypothetical protein